MADLVMGTMSSIIPKLYQLLEEEYNLQTSVKERISSLMLELELAQAALSKVAEVPWDQLDKQVQIWARQVREASYDMEDVLDTFLVRVKGPESAEEKKSLLEHLKKMTNFFKKSKTRHKINGDIKDIMTHLQEVTERCRRYKVDDIVARQATAPTIDPRLAAMYTQVKNLVGMDKSSSDLISMLHNPHRGDVSRMKMKIVSIVGVGGLGKTTLAKAVYDKIKGDFNCAAFVPVGQNPDLKKIYKDILIDLDKEKHLEFCTAALDERQLIDKLRNFLEDKRYLIIIDDIWEVQSWETIKLAINDDKNCGDRIIITTRKLEVATKADEVYKLQPLPYDSSRELFIRRISGHEGKYIHNQPDEILDKFITKCSGLPLAIITMASLLVGKPRHKWSELYNTIDFGSRDNTEAQNTMRILSFSYYDLPSHLRTCLLYLSAFPEDSFIPKESLVWMWVAEGFVHEKKGMRLFEVGEGYFNDLINRSMIQAVDSDYDDCSLITGCRVHDMVLDFICSKSREENFFTVLDNNQDTMLQSNARRLANHKRTIFGQTHQANHFEVPKLRSFIAQGCVIETWAPLSSFTLLRVLAIENCKPRNDSSRVRVEHVGHLLHLRFLSLRGTWMDRIPEEIGALRFLQTLDLCMSGISEWPSSCNLLKRLACLRIALVGGAFDGKGFSFEGMTSLEELSLFTECRKTTRWLLKGLGCLRELRVLNANIFYDKETESDLAESLGHLHKLQSLKIYRERYKFVDDEAYTWKAATELVFPHHLRHLVLRGYKFRKLQSCISPTCLPNLSHLELNLEKAGEQDLKILGRLPELRFLDLELWPSSSVISNISDCDECYFPKLRCFRLRKSMVVFLPDYDKSVSFYLWNGRDDIGMNMDIFDRLLSRDDELQRPLQVQHRNPQHGLLTLAYYLVASFLHVVAFVKRWSLEKVGHRTLVSDPSRGSAAMPSASDDENKDCKGAAAAAPPCFMPSLQVLHCWFDVFAIYELIKYHRCNSLDLAHLSSLREINVGLSFCRQSFDWPPEMAKDFIKRTEAAVRRTAQVHPNHPTLHIKMDNNVEAELRSTGTAGVPTIRVIRES